MSANTRMLRAMMALCITGLSAVTFAEDYYELRHNPFERAFDAKLDQGYRNGANKVVGEMELRAVLFDEKRPMVNVAGHILELGDSYSGYVLREVRRDAAIFYKEGRATLLQLESSDEELAEYADVN